MTKTPIAARPLPPPAGPSQLEQIVTGMTEGVILIEPDRRLVWANEAALAMHGVTRLEDLGGTVDEYRANFVLRFPDGRALDHGQHPVDRVLAGEAFDDIIVEVHHRDNRELDWTHRIRSLLISDGEGRTERLALIIHDATEQAEACALSSSTRASWSLPATRATTCSAGPSTRSTCWSGPRSAI